MRLSFISVLLFLQLSHKIKILLCVAGKELKCWLDLSEISFNNCTNTHTTFILLFTCLIINKLFVLHTYTLYTLLNSANNIYTHTLVTVYYINLCVFQFSITLSKMIAIQKWRMAIDCFHPCGFKLSRLYK